MGVVIDGGGDGVLDCIIHSMVLGDILYSVYIFVSLRCRDLGLLVCTEEQVYK